MPVCRQREALPLICQQLPQACGHCQFFSCCCGRQRSSFSGTLEPALWRAWLPWPGACELLGGGAAPGLARGGRGTAGREPGLHIRSLSGQGPASRLARAKRTALWLSSGHAL